MYRWVARVSVFLFAAAAFAGAPTLVVEGDDGNMALELSAVSIQVTVRGHLARTAYELTYRSSLDRITGGNFTFPLPAEAEVSDLGLWFDGHLRHGVAVERVLARTAYEEIVHRGVDPALAEWSAGRKFQLSVYPIPAKGEKKVYIAYDQDLTADDYVLDVSYRATVPAFEVKIDGGDGATASEENGTIRIARDRRETAMTARSPEDGFWYASAALDVFPPRREAVPAAHTLILYDTSASSVQQDRALLRRFLSGLLARQQAWSTADVLPFHVEVGEGRRIENAGMLAGARELDLVLDSFQPLGATNLMAVASQLPRLTASLPPSTRVVLVTDGLTSLGDSRKVAATVAALSALGRPVLVVHATKTANDELLANLARTTGGWTIDLLQTGVDAAIDTAMHLPVAVRLTGSDVVPAVLLTSSDARFAIAARAREAFTVLPLAMATTGRSSRRELAVRELRGDVEASMVRRAWARAKLRELLAQGAPDDDLIAHGRAFTQLTPRTSLLVLETWQDYQRWDIPMPPDVVEAKRIDEEEEARRAEEDARRAPFQSAPLPPPNVTREGWSVHGRILEDSSIPLPGVTVKLLDGAVVVASDVTDENGRYDVGSATAPIDPSVVAELSGFNSSTRKVEGQLDHAQVDLFLRIASVAEAITVTASASALDVTTSSMATTVKASLRTAGVTTDELLASIATEGADLDSEDSEVRVAVAQQRRELTRAVVAKLRGIGSTAERVRYYLSARAFLGGDKGFHVFAAEAFRERSPEIAARVLSDLAEARPDDAPLLRILARVLDGWGEDGLARLLLERAIELSPAEPQSWREMILLEARHGRASSVSAWSKRLTAGKKRDWMEAVYEQTDEAMVRWEKASFFERQRGLDLRAGDGADLTIDSMYDTGWSWADLHVTEPSGERVAWNHDTSKAGATLTGGYTFGYGPQIYALPRAPRGTYRVALDYYGADETSVGLETLVHVIVLRRGERRDYFLVLAEEQENLNLTAVDID